MGILGCSHDDPRIYSTQRVTQQAAAQSHRIECRAVVIFVHNDADGLARADAATNFRRCRLATRRAQ